MMTTESSVNSLTEDVIRYIYTIQTIGWKWRSFRNAKWPSYWVGEGPQGLNQFSLRLLFDVIPMAWDLPVCVNMHEAAAFAIWKSNKHGKNYRVISELEHHAIRNASQQLKGEGEGEAVDMVLKGPPHGQMMREVMLVTIFVCCVNPVYRVHSTLHCCTFSYSLYTMNCHYCLNLNCGAK